MTDLWATLIGLILGAALVPVHLIGTILVLRSGPSRLPALGWVVGMVVVRLAQGAIFGLLLTPTYVEATDEEGLAITSLLLLVVALLLLVNAGRKLLKQPDDDAPPPAWMGMFRGVAPGKAFLLGAGLIAVDPKGWVFTLGAIGAIEYASLGLGAGVATFVAFTLLTVFTHAGLLAAAMLSPQRADAALAGIEAWLERYNRPILIVASLVFGIYFGVKSLSGLGVI